MSEELWVIHHDPGALQYSVIALCPLPIAAVRRPPETLELVPRTPRANDGIMGPLHIESNVPGGTNYGSDQASFVLRLHRLHFAFLRAVPAAVAVSRADGA